MDGAVQTQPEEPGAAVQPRAGDGTRWSADGEGESSGVPDVGCHACVKPKMCGFTLQTWAFRWLFISV